MEHDLESIINSRPEFRERIIGVPRASSIDKACMRMHVIMAKNPAYKKKEVLSFNNRLTFSWGDALHSMVQNTEIVISNSVKRGWWRCTACNKILGFGASPRHDYKCKSCQARREAIVYHEHSMVVNDPYYLTGHQDLLLELEKGILTVGELKSIYKEGFKKLEKPLGEHILQGTSYLMGMEYDTSPLQIPDRYTINRDYFIIIYITKEALDRKTQAYKIFKVRKNPLFTGIIEEKLLQFKEGYENYPEKLPVCDPLCLHNKFTSTTTKECPAERICQNLYFEGK